MPDDHDRPDDPIPHPGDPERAPEPDSEPAHEGPDPERRPADVP